VAERRLESDLSDFWFGLCVSQLSICNKTPEIISLERGKVYFGSILEVLLRHLAVLFLGPWGGSTSWQKGAVEEAIHLVADGKQESLMFTVAFKGTPTSCHLLKIHHLSIASAGYYSFNEGNFGEHLSKS
jgi:hypothetical protein